jgi:hypothetical protein
MERPVFALIVGHSYNPGDMLAGGDWRLSTHRVRPFVHVLDAVHQLHGGVRGHRQQGEQGEEEPQGDESAHGRNVPEACRVGQSSPHDSPLAPRKRVMVAAEAPHSTKT